MRHQAGKGYSFLTHPSLIEDFDEVAALRPIKKGFGIRIYPKATEHCWTCGDLFDVILTALPPAASEEISLWQQFCRAVCLATGDRLDLVGR